METSFCCVWLAYWNKCVEYILARSIWLATEPPDIQCFRGSVNPTTCHLHFGENLLFIYLLFIRTPSSITDSFHLSHGNAFTFSINSTSLDTTTERNNKKNGHLFLAQSTNSHRKAILLSNAVTSLSTACCYRLIFFWKKKNPSVDSMSMFPALQYPG